LITIEKGKKAPEVLYAPTKTSLRYLQIEDLRPDTNLKFCEPFKCPKAVKSDAIIAWDGANAGTVSCNLEGHIGSTLAILRPVAEDTLSGTFLSRFLQGNFATFRTQTQEQQSLTLAKKP
jgi:type I restriction enzyme, S subunit